MFIILFQVSDIIHFKERQLSLANLTPVVRNNNVTTLGESYLKLTCIQMLNYKQFQ